MRSSLSSSPSSMSWSAGIAVGSTPRSRSSLSTRVRFSASGEFMQSARIHKHRRMLVGPRKGFILNAEMNHPHDHFGFQRSDAWQPRFQIRFDPLCGTCSQCPTIAERGYDPVLHRQAPDGCQASLQLASLRRIPLALSLPQS